MYQKSTYGILYKKPIEACPNNLAPSYNKLIVSFDLDVINYQKVRDLIKSLEIKKKNRNRK